MELALKIIEELLALLGMEQNEEDRNEEENVLDIDRIHDYDLREDSSSPDNIVADDLLIIVPNPLQRMELQHRGKNHLHILQTRNDGNK